ncbi:MAG: NADH-quinone oxidoreductase subunit L, partial [Phycisphaerae bacterium]|nr:NADH-quinone oxidoreductase subunit L [Phycisphaerae bacterium]
QLPLHVWLPDAMEGPTPVSALIHAATMVTAGVYMIARLIVLFQLNEAALVTVAVVGGVTALFAATIALCQYDIKRIWAYSTVSQLGYMFLGVGVLGTVGAVFHLFTHAFFKALLFLTAGTVMHALAGQLDLRKMSGLLKKMPVTGYLMLIGCLALAGVPFTSGFYSKDQILTDALVKYPLLGWLGIGTALLTAFYTFRLWFRVFLGETNYQMGREHHGYDVDHATDEHAHEPHDPPLWASAPLMVLALGALLAGVVCHQWMQTMIESSSAAVPQHGDHHGAHLLVSIVSGGGALVMIALAALFHWKRRDLADRVATAAAPVVRVLHNKYYVDELYDLAIRQVLRAVSWIAYLFDRLVIDGLVNAVAALPRALAAALRPMQSGALQGYALSMGLGLVVILVVAYLVNQGL